MRNSRLYTLLPALLLSAFALTAQAETIEHNYATMVRVGVETLKLENGSQTGITDLLTYQCSGSAKFEGVTISGLSTASLNMPDNTAVVVSQQPIRNLAAMQLFYYPYKEHTNIKLYLSKDGEEWSGPVETGYGYSTTAADLSFYQGDYYIKIVNTTSTAVSIQKIVFTIGECDCKAIVSE